MRKVKKMLAIIPLDVMLKVEPIHEYLEKKALQNRTEKR